MVDYTFGLGDELQFTTQDTDLIHAWNFGDGATSTEPNPSHTYTAYGTYAVTHTARDFCDTCATIGSHTVEIVQTSITVKSILLDRYTAKVGDIITTTVIAQNLTSVYGSGTVSINFGGDILGPYNVTLDAGQETSFTVGHQVTMSGMIDVCADGVCTALSVESNVSIESLTVTPLISTGNAISIGVTVKNNGIFTEDKTITTTIGGTLTIDERLVSLAPNESQTYTLAFDPRPLSNGAYTICADGICKAVSIAIPAPVGSLNVTSFPDIADIWLDNNNTGFKTPSTITDITTGDHNFKITLTGYNDTTGTITILGGITSYIYTSMIPTSPTTGSIAIQSIPTDAEIFLALTGELLDETGGLLVQCTMSNGQCVTTPATITGLDPGDYDILLRLSGYQDYTSTMTISAGQTSYTSVALVPVPITIGSINFTSIPAGAEIWMAPIGQSLTFKGMTPKTVQDLPEGTYDFSLRSLGYNDVIGQMSVIGGETSYVLATMVPTAPLTGSLSISSTPQGADIYLNGAKRIETTPTTVIDLIPGTYTTLLKKQGYNDSEMTIVINTGQTAYVGLTLSTTQVVSAAIPWWLLLGLVAGTIYQSSKKPKDMVVIPFRKNEKGKVVSLVVKEESKGILTIPISDKEKLKLIPRGKGKEPLLITGEGMITTMPIKEREEGVLEILLNKKERLVIIPTGVGKDPLLIRDDPPKY